MICDRYTHMNSHHCYRCNRCTASFDHHCKFLNNCIGGQNYENFFRLLAVFSLYNINIVAMGIWVFVRINDNHTIAFTRAQWGVLALIIITVFIELAVGGLLLFHCYITLCEETTTLAILNPRKVNNPEPYMETPPKINIF
jgi:hypothetical protein